MIIFRPCSAANASSCGRRAIVPSSFMISQMTPAGARPASRARSTAASVWPARSSTPPGRARSGNTWPGIEMSSGRVSGSIAAVTVPQRSAAEMPVVILPLAPIEHVERGALLGGVLVGHRRDAERVEPLARQRQADEAAAVA